MSSISQIIPNYSVGGISDQPDELKKPGQLRDCLNAYPDLINGLFKRPGFQLVSELKDQCTGGYVGQNGTWIPFVRQNLTSKTQENYLFYINLEGEVQAYDMDGNPVSVLYNNKPLSPKKIKEGDISFDDLVSCNEANYFKHDDNNTLKAVTVNNYTVVTNPEEIVTTSKSDNRRDFEAFIEITQLAYSREYLLGIDFLNNDTPNDQYTVATKVNLVEVLHSRSDTNKDPVCPGTYRETIEFDEDYIVKGRKDGQLGMRIDINTTGVQTQGSKNLYCMYRTTLDLLTGGTGWKVGDQVAVTQSGLKGEIPDKGSSDITYIIEVTEVSNVFSPNQHAITGILTPSSGDEVATIGGILSEMKAAIGSATELKLAKMDIVGNGLYIHHDKPFTVSTSEKDLMNILSNTDDDLENPYVVVNNVSRLPIECKDGLIAKVANSFSDDDDYFVQFKSNYGDVSSSNISAASGYWEEIAEPGSNTILNSATMPHVIIFARKDGVPTFVVSPVDYNDRTCGDDELNPSFIDSPVSNIHFYRNRLVFLSQENVIMSRAGDLFNFFPASAIGIAVNDPVDVSVSTNYSSVLQDAFVSNSGMILFSKYQQFRLDTSNDVLSPSSAKISEISRYEYDIASRPVALGTNIGFMGLSTRHSTFYELTNVFDQGPVDVIERSKIVSRTIPADLDLIAESKEANVVFFGKFNDPNIWAYRYFKEGNQNSIQSCWFRWMLPGKLVQHFVIDGDYHVVVEGDNGHSLFLNLQLDALPTQGPFVDLWQTDSNATERPYSVKLDFPTINVVKAEQQQYRSDTTASLVIHRINWNFADIGSYEFVISREGMDDYKVLYESRYMDAYESDADPLVLDVERTVPVYTRNTSLNISLQSDFPHPLVLRSMRWEGDYNDRYYKRV